MDKSEWSGRVGDVWAEQWRHTDRSFEPIDERLVDAVAGHLRGMPAPRILEIGCGAGTTALHVADRVAGAQITGIDLSPALIETAKRRLGAARLDDPEADNPGFDRPEADDRPHCYFCEADAADWSVETGFDLILSRHGVMFFDEPALALRHIRTLARPGAPLVFTCFRSIEANPWASILSAPNETDWGTASSIRPTPGTGASPTGSFAPGPFAPGPFAFADPDHVSAILAEAGWHGATAEPIDFAYVAGVGDEAVGEAVRFFSRIGPASRALRDVTGEDRRRLLDRLERSVHTHCVDDRVAYPGAAWLWTAHA